MKVNRWLILYIAFLLRTGTKIDFELTQSYKNNLWTAWIVMCSGVFSHLGLSYLIWCILLIMASIWGSHFLGLSTFFVFEVAMFCFDQGISFCLFVLFWWWVMVKVTRPECCFSCFSCRLLPWEFSLYPEDIVEGHYMHCLFYVKRDPTSYHCFRY